MLREESGYEIKGILCSEPSGGGRKEQASGVGGSWAVSCVECCRGWGRGASSVYGM